MSATDHRFARVRHGAAASLALALGLAAAALAAACVSDQVSEGSSRSEAVAEAVAIRDWPRAYALVEGSSLGRVEKNRIKAAIHHRRGETYLERREYGPARLEFVEARRLSGNPEFLWDESLAWRGFRNRKLERETLERYLELMPEGAHAVETRQRLKRIALDPIKRPTHEEAAREAAREAAKAEATATKAPPPAKLAPAGARPSKPMPKPRADDDPE